MTVEEGHTATLTEDNLAVSHPFYELQVDQFIVVEEPKYGSITLEASSGMQLSAKTFTPDQLKGGRIRYSQDR